MGDNRLQISPGATTASHLKEKKLFRQNSTLLIMHEVFFSGLAAPVWVSPSAKESLKRMVEGSGLKIAKEEAS